MEPRWHVVQRPFDGPDGTLTPGEVVDAAGWKHLDALVSQRFIRPVTPEEMKDVVVEEKTPPPRKQPSKR